MTFFSPAARLDSLEEYFFSKVAAKISLLNAEGKEVLNLGVGSPDMPPPIAAQEAAVCSIQGLKNHGYQSYKGLRELRETMSTWYKNTYHVDVDPENEIIPLLGSKEGILQVSLAFLNPGDKILVPNPGYPSYGSLAKIFGAQPVDYPLREENLWLPDISELERKAQNKIRLMWINYPHMPTGATISHENLEKILDFTREQGILLCSDNPYGLILNSNPPKSIFEIDKRKEFSLEINSLSKSFHMAGWRIGMLIANKKVCDLILKSKSNTDSGMFHAVQAGAIAALKVKNDWHVKQNLEYSKRKLLVLEIFKTLKFSCDPMQEGLFVWAKAPDNIQHVEDFLETLLLQKQVLLVPGSVWGTNGRRYARSSLCASNSTLQNALDRVKSFMREVELQQ